MCLNKSQEFKIPFQLSAHTISVPIVNGNTERFSFQAVVIETTAEHAAKLRERFYSLGDPLQVQQVYPYIGKYQFAPLVKSREWPIDKIWKLAKFHDNIICGLRPIFIQNLQDLNNKINDTDTLRTAFLRLQNSETIEGITHQVQLIYSIHNTGNPTTKVALIPPLYYDSAIQQLSVIHSGLQGYIHPNFHKAVFLPGKHAGVSSQPADSISS